MKREVGMVDEDEAGVVVEPTELWPSPRLLRGSALGGQHDGRPVMTDLAVDADNAALVDLVHPGRRGVPVPAHLACPSATGHGDALADAPGAVR